MDVPEGPLSKQAARARGYWGSAIPYLGHLEVNLQIPYIKSYSEDVLPLVIPTMTYSEKVPVMVGSNIIDRVMGLLTKGELVRATTTWKQAHFSTVMSGSLQLPHEGAEGNKGAVKGVTPSAAPNPTAPKEFSLDDVQGCICTTWRVTIPPFVTINIHGHTDVQGHYMCVHMHG